MNYNYDEIESKAIEGLDLSSIPENEREIEILKSINDWCSRVLNPRNRNKFSKQDKEIAQNIKQQFESSQQTEDICNINLTII